MQKNHTYIILIEDTKVTWHVQKLENFTKIEKKRKQKI